MTLLNIEVFSDIASLCSIKFPNGMVGKIVVAMPQDGPIDFGPVSSQLSELPTFEKLKNTLQSYSDGNAVILPMEFTND